MGITTNTNPTHDQEVTMPNEFDVMMMIAEGCHDLGYAQGHSPDRGTSPDAPAGTMNPADFGSGWHRGRSDAAHGYDERCVPV